MRGGIVLFDGICNVCNASVRFILKRDPAAYFHFASLQSEVGQKLLQRYHLPSVDSMVLIEHDQCYVKSDAVLRICRRLRGWWKICYIGILIPRPLRDMLYTLVAKHRYQWFGKQNQCMLPPPEWKQRFLETPLE